MGTSLQMAQTSSEIDSQKKVTILEHQIFMLRPLIFLMSFVTRWIILLMTTGLRTGSGVPPLQTAQSRLEMIKKK